MGWASRNPTAGGEGASQVACLRCFASRQLRIDAAQRAIQSRNGTRRRRAACGRRLHVVAVSRVRAQRGLHGGATGWISSVRVGIVAAVTAESTEGATLICHTSQCPISILTQTSVMGNSRSHLEALWTFWPQIVPVFRLGPNKHGRKKGSR